MKKNGKSSREKLGAAKEKTRRESGGVDVLKLYCKEKSKYSPIIEKEKVTELIQETHQIEGLVARINFGFPCYGARLLRLESQKILLGIRNGDIGLREGMRRIFSKEEKQETARDRELFGLINSAAARSERAMNILICHNQGLVYKLAQRNCRDDNEILDRIQWGNIGLYKAIMRFDCNRQTKISTYAKWWIMNEIERGKINKAQYIRLPVHIEQARRKYVRLVRKCDALGIKLPPDSPLHVLGDKTPRYFQELMLLDKLISLDQPSNDGPDMKPMSFVIKEAQQEDICQIEIEEFGSCDSKSQRIRLEKIMRLAGLSRREKQILFELFGVGGQEKNLREVGYVFDLTKERIRQIKKEALAKLRRVCESSLVSEFNP